MKNQPHIHSRQTPNQNPNRNLNRLTQTPNKQQLKHFKQKYKNKTIQALKLLYTSPDNSIVEIHG